MRFAHVHAVADSLSKACDAVNSKDPQAVAECCADYARSVCGAAEKSVAVDNVDTCAELIDCVVSALDSDSGSSVIREVLFEVFEPLQDLSNASSTAAAAFDGLLGKLAAACSPQEVLTLYLAVLSDAVQ